GGVVTHAHSFPTRRSSALARSGVVRRRRFGGAAVRAVGMRPPVALLLLLAAPPLHSQGGGERLRKTDLVRLLSGLTLAPDELARSEEHTSELQSQSNIVCR